MSWAPIAKPAKRKTYNIGDSLVVTDLATNPTLAGLSVEIGRDPELSGRYGRMCHASHRKGPIFFKAQMRCQFQDCAGYNEPNPLIPNIPICFMHLYVNP